MDTPAPTLDCGPVRLRRWRDADLPGMVAAAEASWAQLQPWMPWAQGESDPAAHQAWLATAQAAWSTGEAFQYAILPAGQDVVAGSIGLMRRIGPGGLEIGYWVHSRYAGRGLVGAAAAALTAAGLALDGVDHLEIHCDAANTASAAVAARLGYRHVETRPVPPSAPGETGQLQVWSLTRTAWPDSAAARRWLAGQDAAGVDAPPP